MTEAVKKTSAPFQLTPRAAEDLDALWWFIAEDNQNAAESVEQEILAACRRLAKHPRMGIKRHDITTLPVRFWTITKFPNYVIVYRPETVPLQVVAILHGKRDLKEVLEKRS
ncbi:MAG: type II toxin-antitoxin system RelE/ParE family toxin [Terriglobales bacterium]